MFSISSKKKNTSFHVCMFLCDFIQGESLAKSREVNIFRIAMKTEICSRFSAWKNIKWTILTNVIAQPYDRVCCIFTLYLIISWNILLGCPNAYQRMKRNWVVFCLWHERYGFGDEYNILNYNQLLNKTRKRKVSIQPEDKIW